MPVEFFRTAQFFRVGKRDAENADAFIGDLSSRLQNRIQLSSDALGAYVEAVKANFGNDIDYAQIVKTYEAEPIGPGRYSPPKVTSVDKLVIVDSSVKTSSTAPICCQATTRSVSEHPCATTGCGQYVEHDATRGFYEGIIVGKPDMRLASTSYVERDNLTMRMSMRRFTRLTNAFSKKLENLKAAVNLHFAYYNLVRFHKTVRMPPAMAADVTNKPWTIQDLVRLAN